MFSIHILLVMCLVHVKSLTELDSSVRVYPFDDGTTKEKNHLRTQGIFVFS